MRNSLPIEKLSKLPKAPGVYFFKNSSGEVFYIGKAINIKNRVQSHKADNRLFAPEIIETVEWLQTANEIEALLKESEYIKKFQPKMNIRLRDDKKYFYVGFTKEELPRIFITHQPTRHTQRNSKSLNTEYSILNTEFLGPFTDGNALKITMKYLRRLFPYYSTSTKRPYMTKKHGTLPCSWCHLDLCPGANPSKTQYKKNISAIKKILSGQRNTVAKKITAEMKRAAKEKKYEKAAEARDLVEAMENIFTHHNIVLPWAPEQNPKEPPYEEAAEYISKMVGAELPVYSIEGYDISNIQGKEATASMVRFDHGRPNKSLYRKFTIRSRWEPDDYRMMREVIKRRLEHEEWPTPDLILIDGGRGQLNAALRQCQMSNVQCKIVSLAKREEELYLPNRKSPIPVSKMP
ncbi:MAG: GIY-YIG nuclease family protein, partial [Candidatus Spechtbacteria bacterium]|nr:GIY-YIG nuclease family protein [Candidatus Spechtbacteria bacterium]